MSKNKLWILLGICLISNFAFGITTVWTGSTDDDWAVGSNWDSGVPTIDDLASIFYSPTNDPTIFSGTTADANDLFMGQGSQVLTVEAGATLNILRANTGYLDGNSTIIVEGDVNCTYDIGLGNSKWVDPCDPGNFTVGYSEVILDDANATLDTYSFIIGIPVQDGAFWVNDGGTGVVKINAGTVTIGWTGMYGADRMGFDISSESNGTLSIPVTAQPVWWLLETGALVADSGYGTIEYTTVGDRRVCTARAFDPNVDCKRTFNHDWDNGGVSQSVSENWNYKSNTLPWPGDGFATTGLAPLGEHPIVDTNMQVGFMTIGWQQSSTGPDYLEIAAGGTLDLRGDGCDGAQGLGGLSLGTAGMSNNPGKGTLLMSGGTLYCGTIYTGIGFPDYSQYGEGHIQMNGGVIDCNEITMSVFEDDTLWSAGSIDVNEGTIYISNTGGLNGVDRSNGIDISGTGVIIVEGDIDDEVTDYIVMGKITTDAYSYVKHDYDLTNAGKTTIQKGDCANREGDVDGDCEIDLYDLEAMGSNWLTTLTSPCAPIVGDLNSDCTVNFEDFSEMAAYWMEP
jgi:hypothetical protein